MIHGSRILHNRYSNLEHGELSSVNGIILHQTNSTTAFPTLLAYYWRSVGAHFLIAPGGLIYQTARMDRVCFHVGAIKSKCRVTHTCTPDQTKALKSILASSLPQKDKDFAIHQLEMKNRPISGTRAIWIPWASKSWAPRKMINTHRRLPHKTLPACGSSTP